MTGGGQGLGRTTTGGGGNGIGSRNEMSTERPACTGAVAPRAIPTTVIPRSILVFIAGRFDGDALERFTCRPLIEFGHADPHSMDGVLMSQRTGNAGVGEAVTP